MDIATGRSKLLCKMKVTRVNQLTHFSDSGASRMVDVGEKPVTARTAVASGRVLMRPETLRIIRNGDAAKGNVLEVARLAGIMAAKRTPDLIPLCHGISPESVELQFEFITDSVLGISASVRIHSRTGVEMEALTAVSVAALTVYDMCKSVDRAMEITQIRLEQKSGGQSGDFVRSDEESSGGE